MVTINELISRQSLTKEEATSLAFNLLQHARYCWKKSIGRKDEAEWWQIYQARYAEWEALCH